MLTSIRERAQGWIAWIIIGLIIFVFAVWGIESFFTPNPNVPVLTVGDTEVGLREFQAAYQEQRDHLRSVLGSEPERVGFSEERIKQQVVDNLIERIVLANTARSVDMRIGDATLAAQIDAFGAFQVNGHFSKDRYEQVLRNQGMTPAGFEQKMRGSLLLQQFYSGVTDTAFITPKRLDDYLRLEGQTRDLAYIVLPAAHFLEKAVVSDEEVQHYYGEHGDAYQTSEQVSIAYVELSAAALAPGIAVTDADLQTYYQENRANYRQAERRRASHLLITLDEKADAATVAAAEAKVADLRRQILGGAPFEEIARANSQDPGSASQGGDLGFFGRGAMVKPFEDAVFSMKEGEISEPVHSSFGIHLIKLTGIEPTHDQSFEEARAQVTQELRRTRAEKLFFDRSDPLANLAYEHPDSLDPTATQLGLTIQHAGPFARTGGEGIAAESKVTASAFSEDVLARGNNSEPIELTGNRLVVLRVTNHQPIRRQSLEEVRGTITATLRQEKAQQMAKAEGEGFVKDLRAGTDPVLLSEKATFHWKRVGFVNRKASEPAHEVLSAAFQLSQPTDQKPVYEGLVLPNGDFAIMEVLGIKEGDPAAASATTREDARRQLIKADGEQAFTTLVKDLKAHTNTVVHPERF